MERLLVLVFFALTPLLAVAQSDLKIGFVDAERILRESVPAVRASQKIEKEFEKREADLRAMEGQLRSLQETLERNALTLGEAERRSKERELNDMSREYQRRQRAWREDLSQRQNEELGAVFERANQIIRDIAKAEKFDLIVQETVAVFASSRIDITDKVLKALAEPTGPK